jgi:hypothetical protein
METWPMGVPTAAIFKSFKRVPINNIAEFQPEVGPAKRRRRTSISMQTLNFQTVMTHLEAETLLEFYTDTLKDGALEFTRPDPRTCETITCIFTAVPEFDDFSARRQLVTIQLMKLY